MSRGADMDGPLRPIELSVGLEQIKSRPDRPGTWRLAGGLIVPAPQPGSEAGTPNRPCFPVPVDHEVCEGGAVDGVKQFRIGVQIGQHIGRRYAGALVLSGAVTDPVGSAADLRRVARSLRRVLLHSWCATLIGSMPACFHQARSSLTR